jgi:dipeptidyl aminopeptidase/acylaminoacyl peptidase
MSDHPALAPLSSDDLWDLRLLGDMRLSPDGRLIAFTVETSDRSANERRSAIWLVDLEGASPRQLTSGLKRDTQPRWSPDGTQLAFVSTRAGDRPQLWLMPVWGGEPRQVTRFRRGATNPFWSSDGRWVGCEVEVRDGEPLEEDAEADVARRQREKRDEAERPRIITRLQYRWDGRGYLEGRTHLFRVPLAGGPPAALTADDFDHSGGAVSPDGRWLAYVCDRADDRDANMTSDIWLRDLAAGAQTADQKLTDGRFAVGHLAWSPDGTRLAYLAEPDVSDGHSYHHQRLMVLDVASGAARDLLAGSDLSARPALTGDLVSITHSDPLWSRDGQWVYFLAQRRGAIHVLRLRATGGAVKLVIRGDRAISQLALTPNERHLVALQTEFATLPDLWLYDVERPGERPEAAMAPAFEEDAFPEPEQLREGRPATEPARRLTDLNGQLLAARWLARPERFMVTAEDGWEMEAWLARPAPAQAGRSAPLVLKIHGGPHSTYGYAFYSWLHILTGRGYGVLFANPRGSAGYGEVFAQACDHDWGGGDYRDLVAALDAALARGSLDSDRLAVTGVSYGGYMTNWIVGQTDRFKAAVTVNSVTNLHSSFGTADVDSVWAQGDYGWPWEREAFYRERSPLTYTPRMTTPLRIIAAEEDYRCPISQSEELYTWLKKLGRAPVDFVRFPKASHVAFSSPGQRVRQIELLIEWIERWVPATPQDAVERE